MQSRCSAATSPFVFITQPKQPTRMERRRKTAVWILWSASSFTCAARDRKTLRRTKLLSAFGLHKHSVTITWNERHDSPHASRFNHLSVISVSGASRGSEVAAAHSPHSNVLCCRRTGRVIELYSLGMNLFSSRGTQTLKHK